MILSASYAPCLASKGLVRLSSTVRLIARLVRAIRDTNWRPGPDVGASQKRVRRLRSTIDQIELVVDSGASVACHRDVCCFARNRFVRAIRYADRCACPYICAGQEAIGSLCCTVDKVVLGVYGRASVPCDGCVC